MQLDGLLRGGSPRHSFRRSDPGEWPGHSGFDRTKVTDERAD